MGTFDGWETQLYGDVLALPGQPSEDELMHFRTKGSKNGVRRYQTASGEWTPLGLKERKAREGWGQSKAERRAEKLLRRSERRAARKERVAAAKEAYVKRKAGANLKNLSDDELQRRINRAKKEIEYKELTKSPVVKMGEHLVKSYFDAKDKKLDREMKRAELIVKQQEARQRLIASKAALSKNRGAILDNIMRGTNYMTAKKQLLDTKHDKTIRGAIRGAIGGAIKKEGERFVNGMGNQSLLMRGGRAIKSRIDKGRDWTVKRISDAYTGDKVRSERLEKERQKKRNRKLGQELRG